MFCLRYFLRVFSLFLGKLFGSFIIIIFLKTNTIHKPFFHKSKYPPKTYKNLTLLIYYSYELKTNTVPKKYATIVNRLKKVI